MLMQGGNVNECRSRNIPLNRRYKNIRVHFKEAILSPLASKLQIQWETFPVLRCDSDISPYNGKFPLPFSTVSMCTSLKLSDWRVFPWKKQQTNRQTKLLHSFFFSIYTIAWIQRVMRDPMEGLIFHIFYCIFPHVSQSYSWQRLAESAKYAMNNMKN